MIGLPTGPIQMPVDFGEPAPFFIAKASNNRKLDFGALAGFVVLLVFIGSEPTGAHRVVKQVKRHRTAFDDKALMLFFVVSDTAQLSKFGISHSEPGVRFFLDHDGRIANAFGYGFEVSTHVVLLDRTLRCVMSESVEDGRFFEIARIIEAAKEMQAWNPELANSAPVLVLDRVFEPAVCRNLIDHYAADGGTDAGFWEEINGSLVFRKNPCIVRRRECAIADRTLLSSLTSRLQTRLFPMILRAYQCQVTRIEQHSIARYDAADGGFASRRRANTTDVTAHLRFAVVINLNTENYEGGNLWFPEFGEQTYRAPTGGAIVFSCSLLYEDLPVTRGVRFAYLSFLSNGANGTPRDSGQSSVHAIRRSTLMT